MKINDLKLKINEYEVRMKAISETAEMTDELRQEFDGLVTKRDVARADLKRAESAEAINLQEAKEETREEGATSIVDKWVNAFRTYAIKGDVAEEFRGTQGGLRIPAELLRYDPLLASSNTAIINKTVGATSVKTPAGFDWLRAMGATFDENLTGNYVLPSIATVTAGFVTEGGDTSTFSVAPANITLAPRALGGNQSISKLALQQTNPDLLAGIIKVINFAVEEAVVKDAFTQAAADLTTARLQSTVVVAPDYAKMLALDSSIGVSMLRPVYVMSKAAKNYLKQVNAGSAGIKFVIGDDDTINGIPVFAHPSLPANRFFLLDANDLHIGMWGAPELIIDNFSQKRSLRLEFQIQAMCDTGYANPASGVYYDSSTF